MIIWVAGKGGVGRTTVAAALALQHADAGQRVLLLSDVDVIGGDGPDTLLVQRVRPAQRWKAFRDRHGPRIESLLASGTLFDDPLARAALSLRPPVLDAFGFGQALLESDADLVVVDAPATGHLLRLFDGLAQASSWLDAAEALRDRTHYLEQHFGGRSEPVLEQGIETLRKAVETLDRRYRASEVRLVALREPTVIAETDRLERALSGRVRTVTRVWNRDAQGLPAWDHPLRGALRLRRWWSAAPGDTPKEHDSPSHPVTVLVPLRFPDEQFTWVVGHGGVGKTTTACALACQYAALGHRTLLANLDPANSVDDVLGLPASEPVEPDGRLVRFSIDPTRGSADLRGRLLQDLEEASLRGSTQVDLPFDRPALEALLAAAPSGLDGLLGLWQLGTALDGDWDRVVVDTPPGRHFVDVGQRHAQLTSWRRWLQAFLVTNQRLLRLTRLNAELRSLRRALAALRSALDKGVALLVTRPHRLEEATWMAERLRHIPLPLTGTIVQSAQAVGPLPSALRPAGWLSRGRVPTGPAPLTRLGASLFQLQDGACLTTA